MPSDNTGHKNALVREVREEVLRWSRAQLAEFLGVSEDTVRKWEDESNPCEGPARRLLEVLKVWPTLPTWLNEAPDRPPEPMQVPKDSPPWTKLRKVFRMIHGHHDREEQEALFFRVGIDQKWLDDAERQGLLQVEYCRGRSRNVIRYGVTDRAMVWFSFEWTDGEGPEQDGETREEPSAARQMGCSYCSGSGEVADHNGRKIRCSICHGERGLFYISGKQVRMVEYMGNFPSDD